MPAAPAKGAFVVLNAAPPRALASPTFRLLWLGILGGNSGRWAFTMLATWLAYAQTHSPEVAGLTVFALQMPAIVMAPLAGVLADRVSRRRLLSASLLVSAGATLAAMVLLHLHLLGATALVVLAFAVGCGTTVQSTAQNSLLPATVAPGALFEAVALQGTARQGAEFFGPALVSPILALWGPMAALVAMTAMFAVAAVPVSFLRLDGSAAADSAARPRPGMLSDGVRYVRQHPILLPTLLLVATHCLLTMSYMGLFPSLAEGVGIRNSAAYGGLMTTVGLGAVTGTLAIAILFRRAHAGRLLWTLSLLSAAGVGSLGLARNLVSLEAAAFLVGVGTAAFMSVAVVRIQQATEESMRGRVMSIYLLLAGGSMAIGNWAYGALAASVPARSLVVGMGVLFALVVLVAGTFWRPVRHIYRATDGHAPSTAVAV